MAIFAPTNITPSSTGPLGSGVVDANKGIDFSWQVNGSSSLNAFQITVYENTAASTQVYTTGKLRDGCPFFGVDYKGDTQFFEYKMPKTGGYEGAIKNGKQYKFTITQWWGSDIEVVQPSASVFVTQTKPEVYIENAPAVLEQKDFTFEGYYSQLGAAAKADSFNWVRWKLFGMEDNDGDGKRESRFLIKDTGNIYGTGDLKFYYDGFFTGNEYEIELSLQTERGVIVEAPTEHFRVEYEQKPIETTATASIARGGRSAIKVEWKDFYYIYGKPTGPVKINSNGTISLLKGGSVLWDNVTGNPMEFASPYMVIARAKLHDKDAKLLSIGQTGQPVEISYLAEQNVVRVSNVDASTDIDRVSNNAEVWIIVTPSDVYLRWEQPSGGLNPGDTVYPSETLYPRADTGMTVFRQKVAPSFFRSSPIKSIKIGGEAIFDYAQVISAVPDPEIIQAVYQNGTYEPNNQPGTVFQVDFSNGLNAGGDFAGGVALKSWAVYRQRNDAKVLEHIVDVPLGTNEVYDYSARSRQGRYRYYIFPVGEKFYLTNPVITNAVVPCFWNWTILEATGGEDGRYAVAAEYAFGKNLGTSATSNNNTPGIMQNFTRYPTIQRSPLNYKTGSLTSLIGIIDTMHDCEYSDTIELRDAIENLSTTQNALFLKSRKGDLFPIVISAPITMQTMDNWKEQAQEAMIPWVQIGGGEEIYLYSTAETPLPEPDEHPNGRTYDDGYGNLYVDSDAVGAFYDPVEQELAIDTCQAAHVTDNGNGDLTWWWWSDT